MTGSIQSHRYEINRSVFTEALEEEEEYITKNVLPSDTSGAPYARDRLHKEFEAIRSEVGEGLYVGMEPEIIAFSCALQDRVNEALTRTLYGDAHCYRELFDAFAKTKSDVDETSFDTSPYTAAALRGGVIGGGLAYMQASKDVRRQETQFIDSLKDFVHAEDKSLEKKEYNKAARQSYQKYIKSRLPEVKPKAMSATATGRLMHKYEVVTRTVARSAEEAADKAKHIAKKEMMKLDVMAGQTARTVMRRAFFGGAIGSLLYSIFEPSDAY